MSKFCDIVEGPSKEGQKSDKNPHRALMYIKTNISIHVKAVTEKGIKDH